MRTEDKILKIIERLLAKTRAGEIQWERTSREDVFQTAFPNYVVKLTTDRNQSSETPDYIVSIIDASGVVLESASDVEIRKAFPAVDAYSIMKDLYGMARRGALGVDAALDSLLGELEDNVSH